MSAGWFLNQLGLLIGAVWWFFSIFRDCWIDFWLFLLLIGFILSHSLIYLRNLTVLFWTTRLSTFDTGTERHVIEAFLVGAIAYLVHREHFRLVSVHRQIFWNELVTWRVLCFIIPFRIAPITERL